uniref:Uncharacterized protein n=1 Tax=Siphoviridae sp. ct9UA16 TaxID=2827793 RepID=A0A8S5TM82_9CAUD|nr:MAG TPA: hypothetical protein [Siphoviridae sp. ct9UA16]DAZ44400.1 MAG TPA: hypothetical protein [Caudoviricetes sp.]
MFQYLSLKLFSSKLHILSKKVYKSIAEKSIFDAVNYEMKAVNIPNK